MRIDHITTLRFTFAIDHPVEDWLVVNVPTIDRGVQAVNHLVNENFNTGLATSWQAPLCTAARLCFCFSDSIVAVFQQKHPVSRTIAQCHCWHLMYGYF